MQLSSRDSGGVSGIEMRKAIECAFGPKKIYEMIKDGISSQNDFILTYKDVKAHFEEETISLIEDVFHGEEIDFYGNLGNSFYMDTIKTLNKEKIEVTTENSNSNFSNLSNILLFPRIRPNSSIYY